MTIETIKKFSDYLKIHPIKDEDLKNKYMTFADQVDPRADANISYIKNRNDAISVFFRIYGSSLSIDLHKTHISSTFSHDGVITSKPFHYDDYGKIIKLINKIFI